MFKSKTRDEWCKIMEGTDVCFAPVLTMAEAPNHPHMAAREIFVSRHGVTADSTITARDSFDSPRRRSTKVIGTSPIVNPRRDATKSISTRNE